MEIYQIQSHVMIGTSKIAKPKENTMSRPPIRWNQRWKWAPSSSPKCIMMDKNRHPILLFYKHENMVTWLFLWTLMHVKTVHLLEWGHSSNGHLSLLYPWLYLLYLAYAMSYVAISHLQGNLKLKVLSQTSSTKNSQLEQQYSIIFARHW